jgi:arsenate reductase
MALVASVARRLGPGISVDFTSVDSPEAAKALHYPGSPTVLVNGADIEGRTSGTDALACRLYGADGGVPPQWLVEAAVIRALNPSTLLFLCVANSARSQMAEGIARSLAPPHITVWSAGSRPTRVRDEAIKVLAEIGIDIRGQHAKSVADIPPNAVDVVVTLCAEEECPVYLGNAKRLHWAMPDPAAAVGDEEHRLQAFRNVRDELMRRLRMLLHP